MRYAHDDIYPMVTACPQLRTSIQLTGAAFLNDTFVTLGHPDSQLPAECVTLLCWKALFKFGLMVPSSLTS
jgi:hypothetical protein